MLLLPPGWDGNPLQGLPPGFHQASLVIFVCQFVLLGGERYCKFKRFLPNITLWPSQLSNPGLSNPESSTLTIMPIWSPNCFHYTLPFISQTVLLIHSFTMVALEQTTFGEALGRTVLQTLLSTIAFNCSSQSWKGYKEQNHLAVTHCTSNTHDGNEKKENTTGNYTTKNRETGYFRWCFGINSYTYHYQCYELQRKKRLYTSNQIR